MEEKYMFFTTIYRWLLGILHCETMKHHDIEAAYKDIDSCEHPFEKVEIHDRHGRVVHKRRWHGRDRHHHLIIIEEDEPEYC